MCVIAMDPHMNMNMVSTMPHVSVKIEETNNEVVELRILENDVGSEMFLPQMYITEAPTLIIGSNKPVNSTMKQISLAESKQITNTQYTNKLVTVTPPIAPVMSHHKTYKNLHYTDVIPESSKRSAINKQIELYPLNYVNQYFKRDLHYLVNTVKLEPDVCNELNPCLSGFLNQPEAPSINIINSHASDDNNVKPGILLSKTMEKRKVQNYIHMSDTKVPQRAVAVLPTALALRGKDNIFPRRTLPMRIRFGPVEGIHKVIARSQAQDLVSNAETPVFLLKRDNEIIHIDVSDRDKCNWMGLLPLGEPNAANVWLYQEGEHLYAITTEPVNTRGQLKLGYSKKYAESHKLPPGVPTLDLEAVLSSNPKQWWCNECSRALPSAPLLQRHSDVYHKDDIISTRRGYRCVQCRRMFSRLFTLRRHLSKHCTKKVQKPIETTEAKPIDLSSTLSAEENRLPSDESFQNFTNGLDFSASFFDTDRISNLDISGNSRADDFNPYDISFRDDTCTSNDLSFAKLTSGANTNEAKIESTPSTTRNCSRAAKKQIKRKHASDSRRLECACGRTFRNSEKLAQHFLKEHSTDDVKTNKKSSPDKNKYTCDQCKTKRVSFKRRGMLVNHLWRAHKMVSTLKVERPVRHYPCVACTKIYRSAAKRDKHIAVHHPGAERLVKSSIEGGVRSCEPAACEHCPRQYATRAKLLQHVRATHPHTVPPHMSIRHSEICLYS